MDCCVAFRRHPLKVKIPTLNRFCITKEDFHNEYGLNMDEKIHPRSLIADAEVTERQWLSVFTHSRVSNEKVHHQATIL